MGITYKMGRLDGTTKKDITEITYNFVNHVEGEKRTIKMHELSEEWQAVMKELKREDDNCEQRERRRRRIAMTYAHNQDFITTAEYDAVEHREWKDNLAKAISKLSPEQKRLIQQIYYMDVPAVDIAEHEGVSKSAITHRKNKVLETLKKDLAA
jgi:RNA polymerase sigma factor (sigma-70 family)